MTESSARLRPYLPRILMAWLQEAPGTIAREVEGTVVFVDISGFTKMSERLARNGKVGAEEVTDVLSSVFAELLVVAYENGGSLVKFGGDALLLFFSEEDHQLRAARAAFGMRRALRSAGRIQTTAGLVTLRMSVGVNSGVFHFFLVGGLHKELVIAGPAATETVLMENTAQAGDILLGPATAGVLPPRILGAAKGDGVLLRSEPSNVVSIPAEPVVQGDVLDLAHCVPVALREHLLAGKVEPEHRQVTVAFVHFDGTDRMIGDLGSEFAAFALDELVTTVQDAADRHGVTFLGTDVDRDGGKIILVAGAPDARGEDEERMLLTLRAIAEAEPPIPLRIGTNSGHVFVGDVGSAYRRTFTVMGDAVNLAARVMAKAEPGEILATSPVLDAAHVLFETEALEPFMVKGKRHPVVAFRVLRPVGSRQADDADQLPVVGREAEIAELLDAVEGARRGRGRLVELVGEAGMGKSRLLKELEARAPDLRTVPIVCEPYLTSSAYFPFNRLLRGLLGIPDDASGEDAAAHLRSVVEADASDLLPWLPLLAMPLDLVVPETPETRMLEGRFRTERLGQAIADLLARVVTVPSIVTIEDAHWIDEASLELLGVIARRIEEVPLVICTARREVEQPGNGVPGATTLAIGPLVPEDATMLVQLATEDAPLTPHTVRALVDRAGGSPRFLRAMVFAIRQAGADVDELPSSVEGLVTALIDRLPRADRARLRYLSVLGMSFSLDLASELLGAAGLECDEPLLRRLVGLIDPDGLDGYRFRNGLTRDVAYQSLPFRRRRELHGEVGRVIEREAGDDPEDLAELLSFHYFHAQRFEAAWRYSRVGGERARVKYANVEAAELYRRAVESARHLEDIPPVELARVLGDLGDVRSRAGRYADAATAYRAARRLIRGDVVGEAEFMLKEARTSYAFGNLTQALRWAGRGIRLLEEVEAPMTNRAELISYYAWCRFSQGLLAQAARWCERAIREAEGAGDRETLAHAYQLLDVVLTRLGRQADLPYGQLALSIYEEIGNLWGQAITLNTLGNRADGEGRWTEAIEFFDRAGQALKKVGDTGSAAVADYNIGEILSRQGSLEEAEIRIRDALRVARAVGDREGVAFATRELGWVAFRIGRTDEGLALLYEGRSGFQELGAQAEVVETDARIAECQVLSGEWQAALGLVSDSLKRAKALSAATVLPTLHRVRGYGLMQAGRLEEARHALEQALATSRSLNVDYETAFVLLGQARLARLSRDPSARELGSESSVMIERLGVVSTPAVLLSTAPEPLARIGDRG